MAVCSSSSAFVFTVFSYIGFTFVFTEKQNHKICITSACKKTAKLIVNNMDVGVDPCQDFYRFACGGFLNKTTIPTDRSIWTVTSDLELKVLRTIEAEFNSSSISGEKPRYFQLAWKFYRSCMDIVSIEERDLEDIKAHLEQLGGWPVMDDYGIWDPDTFNWVDMSLRLAEQGWCWDMIVDVVIGLDARNTSRYRIELSQADLGIPREYLINGLEDDVVLAYYEVMVEVAVEFGVPFHYAKEDMSDVLMFEIELAKISVPQEEMRDHFRLENPMTLLEMDERFPNSNWSHLITASLERYCPVSPEEVVNVMVPSYFHHLGDLLDRVDKRIIANYMLWHMVYESLPFLSVRVAHIRRKLMIALTGTSRFKPRWEFCVSNLIDRFEHVVGAAYIRKYVNPRTKLEATDMIRVLQREFRKLISEVPWMDARTRLKAERKAESMFYHVAYPDELLDDSVLERYYRKMNISEDLLTNVLHAQLFETSRAFSKLNAQANKTRWDLHSEVTEINAYFMDDQNAVEIPAGILQDIFYTPERPNYLNFGALGSVIAHEMMHSIDDEGRQYDDNGNLNLWWDEESLRQFSMRAKDIVLEYSNYTVKEVNMTLNAMNVQGEMIADHGAMKLAYNAYQSSTVDTTVEPRLATLEQYSPNQMFWLMAANSWCTKERKESLRSGITVDTHPPAEVRVNGPFMHSEHFSHDWACPRHSYMNPTPKYNVW